MELVLRDVCAPDYLQSHNGYLLNVIFQYPCEIDDIKTEILDEINAYVELPKYFSNVKQENLNEIAKEILNEFSFIWNSIDMSDEEKDTNFDDVFAYIEILEDDL